MNGNQTIALPNEHPVHKYYFDIPLVGEPEWKTFAVHQVAKVKALSECRPKWRRVPCEQELDMG